MVENQTTEEYLKTLASQGHSRTSAFKAAGMSWHSFRLLAAEYPHIQWRTKGKHNARKGAKTI